MNILGKTALKLLLLLLSFSVLSASTETGLTWLNAQVSSDNNYTTSTKIATPLQSLSEMQNAVLVNGGMVPSIVVEQISSNDYNSTEYLSRKIRSKQLNGDAFYAELNLLLKNQTVYGSFAELEGFHGTVLDTAFALETISRTDVKGTSAQYAISYLLDKQQANGSWVDGANIDSDYLTALVLTAMTPYKNTYNISSNLDKAYEFLTTRTPILMSEEKYLAALSMKAMLEHKNDKTSVETYITQLLDFQDSNGSWDNDIYVTAVILQTLLAYEKPNINVGSVSGSILNGLTATPLENAQITLIGDQNLTTTTNAQGEYSVKDIEFGDYRLLVNADTFQSVYTDITITNNQNIQIAPISLSVALSTSTSVIKGHITDIETSEVLEGVNVRINGATVTSDINGDYEITGLVAGAVTIEIEKLGYVNKSVTTDLPASTILIFSPELLKISSAKTSISGLVSDSKGIPLQGATVQLSISNTHTAITDEKGEYSFSELNSGDVDILVSLNGFQSSKASVKVEQNNQYNFSPTLYSLGTYSIKGKVLDSSTSTAIEGAVIQSNVSQASVTDVNGDFVLKDFNTSQNTLVDVTISANNYYTTVLKSIPLNASIIDVSSISLDPRVDENNSKITGKVTNADSGELLAGVTVKVDGTNQEITTDATGNYTLDNITQEDFSLLVLADGFRTKEIPVHLDKASVLNLDINLEYFQASGLVVQTLSSDKSTYSAYESVSFNINLVNDADLVQKVQLISEIVNSNGLVLERKQLNGAVASNGDTYDNILPHSELAQQTLWYTSSNTPGEYTYKLRVIDPFTQNLLADTSTIFTISATQKLDKLCMKTNPSLTYTGATKTVKVSTIFSSHSNSNVNVTYLFKLTDPQGTLVNSKEVSVELKADETSKDVEVDKFVHTFTQSGQYQVTAEIIDGITPVKVESTLITVLPSIHIEASQNISPKTVTPDGNKNIRVNIQLKGVVK